MPDDDGARPRTLEHFGRDIAGEGSGRLGVAVLAADPHRAAARGNRQLGQKRRRRTDHVSVAVSPRAPSTILANSAGAATFIFQLPATSGRRGALGMCDFPCFACPTGRLAEALAAR
jgi:hypothetical protein